MKGFFFIDKPKGVTSFDVVRKIKKLTGIKKVGHAGTLDPLATGLLIVAVGEATKFLEFIFYHTKTYQVRGVFGYKSDTYDADGQIMKTKNISRLEKKIDQKKVEAVIRKNFLGVIRQVPPIYSAIKIHGERAYDLARKGRPVQISPREVLVKDFRILNYDWPKVDFYVECGTGTYIRSLINDLGDLLGVGAYVADLRRTSVEGIGIEESVKLGLLNNKIGQYLRSPEVFFADHPILEISLQEWQDLKHGRYLLNKKLKIGQFIASYEGQIVAVLESYHIDNKTGVKIRKMIH